MVRQALTTVAIALGLGRGPGCGDVDDPKGGTNAPCTRSSDCGRALVCLEGVCREPDAGTSAAPDAASGGSPEDAGDAGG